MYTWEGSGLSILWCPKTGTVAVSPHKTSSALVHLAGGLVGGLSSTPIQVPSLHLSRVFNLLGFAYLLWVREVVGGKGRLTSSLLTFLFFSHWAPPIMYNSWSSFQHCLVNQFPNRAAVRGYPGTIPKDLIFP